MPDHALRLLSPTDRPLAARIGLILAGIAFLSISSHISIPMVPVPVTMQTFAVTAIGALFGWRYGALTVILWLAAGAAGLPVLSGSATGLQKFVGPTGGYLIAFPFAAAVVGQLVEQGWNGRRIALCFVAMLIGNALCLAIGASWLAVKIGLVKALMSGVVPFLIGATLKSALAAALMAALERVSAPKS